ncbi:MAG: potassium channel protein [Gemmatimonadota bacterium]|nr:potassium channel protein [Gemmatimonadota bacterium]
MIFRGSQLAMVAAYFVVLVAAGTVGYEMIEGWSWADSFYMTIITITAVGYHEVHPLSETGRIFTVFMLVGGLTGLGAWFALITASLVRMDLRKTYERRKTMKKAGRMKDHVIVCGGGNMGQQITRELGGAGTPCAVIESDRDAIESLREINPEVAVIEDDATRDRVLREAGIERARGLVTCLSADTDNLFVCLSARDLNARLVIVARAEGKSATAKMYRAGADHVVSPNKTGAVWVASVLVRPSVASFMDTSEKGRHLSRHIDQATVGTDSKVVGRTLGEARVQDVTGLLVIAIHKHGQPYEEATFNPDASTRLEAGDDLIVLGDDEQVERLRAYVG